MTQFNNYARCMAKENQLHEWYEWRVFVDESNAILDNIDHVTYYLPSNFQSPVRTVYDRRTKFSLEASSYTNIDISITVNFKDGKEEIIRYELDFNKLWPKKVESGIKEINLMPEADLRNIDLHDKKLSGIDLHKADLRSANLNGVDLSNANLENANLMRAELSSSNLKKTNLGGADLRLAVLWYTDLEGANLKDANMTGIQLYTASLKQANLEGAIILNSGLMGAKLDGAILNRADIRGTTFQGASFDENTELQGVDFDEITVRTMPEKALNSKLDMDLREKLRQKFSKA